MVPGSCSLLAMGIDVAVIKTLGLWGGATVERYIGDATLALTPVLASKVISKLACCAVPTLELVVEGLLPRVETLSGCVVKLRSEFEELKGCRSSSSAIVSGAPCWVLIVDSRVAHGKFLSNIGVRSVAGSLAV
eukprot:6461485-Amphidinium_carterae.1